MGACATKFAVLKNASDAPLPLVKCEVEGKEVNPVEEVAVEKDDAQAVEVEDEAKCRQSLGHLLLEGEGKKGPADNNGNVVEVAKPDDVADAKPEAVADAPSKDETEKAPIADVIKSRCVDEETQLNHNVEMEAMKEEVIPTETLKVETIEKPVDIPVMDKEPGMLEMEKTLAKEAASNEEEMKIEEKPAEASEVETSKKTPETHDCERTEEHNLASDGEKQETHEKSTEVTDIETLEKKAEEPEAAAEEQKPALEAEIKSSEEMPCEISDEKPPKSPEMEKPEEPKQAADTDMNVVKKESVKNTNTDTEDIVEDKHVLETAENPSCGVQKPASDAEKPEAKEEKASA